MKISIPNGKRNIEGMLRDVSFLPTAHPWQIKITTELSNVQNMYLSLTEDEMNSLLESVQNEKKRLSLLT